MVFLEWSIVLRLLFVGKVSIWNGQSNVALATLFKMWLAKKPLPFFSTNHNVGVLVFPALVSGYVFCANVDWFIVMVKLTGLTTHLYLYSMHCWSRLRSHNRQHVYWLYGGTGQKPKKVRKVLYFHVVIVGKLVKLIKNSVRTELNLNWWSF